MLSFHEKPDPDRASKTISSHFTTCQDFKLVGKLHCFFDPRDIHTGPNYRSSRRDTVILEYFNMKKYSFCSGKESLFDNANSHHFLQIGSYICDI